MLLLLIKAPAVTAATTAVTATAATATAATAATATAATAATASAATAATATAATAKPATAATVATATAATAATATAATAVPPLLQLLLPLLTPAVTTAAVLLLLALQEVKVSVKHLVPLSQMVAISSSFFASGAAVSEDLKQQKMASTEELVNWGLFNTDPKAADPAAAKAMLAAGITPEKGSAGPASSPASAAAGAPMARQMGFADGGSVDNNGVMPLLRRKVEHIVICVAADQPADQDWETYAKECCEYRGRWFRA